MRLLWYKMNKLSVEELEPELVDYQCKQIDLDRMTLMNANVPLVLMGLTLRNYRAYEEFYVCRKCGKVYWQGSHWQRRVDRTIQSNDNEEEEEDDDGIVFYDAQSKL